MLYKFLKNKKRKPTQEEIIRSIPPKEYALKQLDELTALNLIEKGYIKEYYDKLSDIIRFYISRTYNVDSMEKTTSEIYLMLKNKIPAEYNRELKRNAGYKNTRKRNSDAMRDQLRRKQDIS